MSELLKALNLSESPYINSLILLATFIIIALIMNFIVFRLIKRLTRFTKSEFDDKIINALQKPVFFTIVILGFIYSLNDLVIIRDYLLVVKRIVYTLLTIVWSVTSIRIANNMIEYFVYKIFDITGLKKDIIPLIENITKIAIIIGSIFTILTIWNIDITPIIASAGIASAVIAFAAKDTIANLFGGISVFLDKPYKIGDYIELDQGRRGEVVEIGMRSTRIKTRDDILISIPNAIIVNSQIVNESAPVEKFRVRIPIGVAYGSDIDKVEKILMDIATNNDNVLEDPEPRVRFRKFGDSSLDFELLCWAREPAIRGLTIHLLNSAIYKQFNENGITIPFPQRDIHIIGPDKNAAPGEDD